MSSIAFFGATGGCTLACLVKTLKTGIDSRALVRTPAKLEALLLAGGVSQDTLNRHLIIVPGNTHDSLAVQNTLKSTSGEFVSRIISGLGGKPKMTLLPFKVTSDDPTICGSSMETLLSAIALLDFPSPPLIAVVSTTGLTSVARDVPILYGPLYHWMLKEAHADKKAMEDRLLDAGAKGLVGGWVVVKPTLLTDGEERGEGKVRVGREEKPQLGYSVSRREVGAWMFRDLVERGVEGFGAWKGTKVTLTY